MMEYFERIDDKRKIIFVNTEGELLTAELGPLSGKTRVRAKELNYLMLFDFRNSRNLLSIEDVYHWFTDHYDAIDQGLKRIPSAHLVDREHEDFFANMEMIWRRRGGIVKTFTDRESALDWLARQVEAAG